MWRLFIQHQATASSWPSAVKQDLSLRRRTRHPWLSQQHRMSQMMSMRATQKTMMMMLQRSSYPTLHLAQSKPTSLRRRKCKPRLNEMRQNYSNTTIDLVMLRSPNFKKWLDNASSPIVSGTAESLYVQHACMEKQPRSSGDRKPPQTQKNHQRSPNQAKLFLDQLESPTPGFVAQLTGILTNKRYNYVTVFVDGYTGYGYVHLQKSSGSEETLEAKHMFEQICARASHRVEHYHADNGIFIAHAWKDDCRRLGQGFSYAGVDAHHQNGKAEARIRRLQELARAMLNHAKRR